MDGTSPRVPRLPPDHPKRQEYDRHEAAFSVLQEGIRIAQGIVEPRALDVGGGDGSSLTLLDESIGFHSMISVDISLPANGVLGRISYRQARAEELTSVVPPGSADVVLMVEVLEHLDDPDAAILAVHRVLSPRGGAVITTPNLSSLLNRLALLMGYLPLSAEVSSKRVFGRPGTTIAGHLRLHTSRSLKEFLTYYGFYVDRFYTIPNSRSMYEHFGRVGAALGLLDRLAAKLPGNLGSRIVAVVRVQPG